MSSSAQIPAAWGELVSVRPTPGLVSRSGMWDGYPSPQAQMGPMARSVRDVAILLGMYPPFKPTRGLVSLNTFVNYSSVVQVPAGFTSDNLPVEVLSSPVRSASR